jgi:sortase (surface protein transpeptidase)
MAVCISGCAGTHGQNATPSTTAAPATPAPTPPASKPWPAQPAPPAPDPPAPAALFAKGLSVRAGPVPVPLQLRIPSIGVNAQTLGVGVTVGDVMDAPEGRINDPVWEEAFWYRGSAVPGVVSTALIAGHVNGPRGTHGVFEHLDRLHPGDLIVVHDTRNGLDVRFEVTGARSFTLAQTTQPSILTQIYGVGPVAGTTPQRSKDGLARLTLMSCAGTFQTGLGTHDHRLAVFATRVA